jgi:ubiquitin-activating enzyme E1
MTEIDTSLYDRQIRTYGVDALKKITNSSITIVGLENGLSTEILKNLALGGVKTIGLYDNNLITYSDIETGFYYSEKDIGKIRSEVLIPKVQELNPYVVLKKINSEDDFIVNSVLIIVNKSTSEISRLEKKFGYRMVVVFSKGVAGMVFVNAGEKHVVLDSMGENIEPVQIGSIDSSGKIQCAPNTSHDFQSGDYIRFTNLEGDNIDKLSDKEFKIQVISPTCFKLELNDDLTNVKLNNGTAILIKKPIEVNHQQFSEQVKSPSFNFSFDDSTKIFNSLTRYIDNEENLKTENPWSNNHTQKLSHNFCAQDIDLIRTFSCDFLPVHSLVGSVAASETIKIITNKYLPINQFWCWYEPNMIIKNKPSNMDENSLGINSIARLYGSDFEKYLSTSSWFLVGSGAIGCELLKNLAYIGVSCDSKNEGRIYITDPDTIEKSNLNRQFLFRSHHISKPKSLMAAESISTMRKINITPYTQKVCKENQNFSDTVMKNVTGVFNALDNIHARRYMDEQCFYKQKPLFESGTTGTKGNTQPVIPFLTETYSNSADPPQEKSFPICTIKNFPNEIQHTIHWAMDYFELFNRAPQNIMKWIKDSTVFNQGISNDNSQGKEDVMNFLIKLNIKTFDSCIERAVDMFYLNYKNSILQLLTTYPSDSKNEDGNLFWSNGKRAPKSLDRYDSSDENQLNYIEATSHLLARVYNINDSFDREYIKKVSSEYKYNDVFKADDKMVIAKNDTELKELKEQREKQSSISLEIELPNNSDYLQLKLNAQEFEKDDPTNWHVSFITAASNLRAINYGIPTASYQETKGIAGRIIPAIATTTSVVAGLIVLEMFKYMLGKYEMIENKIENYRSTFVNLADTTLVYSEPIPSGQIEIAGNKFNSWTRFEYYQNTTLSKFKEYFENVFKTTISMIVYDNKILYADFMGDDDLDSTLELIIKSKNEDVNFSNSVILTIASTDDSINLPEIHFLLYPAQNKIASI